MLGWTLGRLVQVDWEQVFLIVPPVALTISGSVPAEAGPLVRYFSWEILLQQLLVCASSGVQGGTLLAIVMLSSARRCRRRSNSVRRADCAICISAGSNPRTSLALDTDAYRWRVFDPP